MQKNISRAINETLRANKQLVVRRISLGYQSFYLHSECIHQRKGSLHMKNTQA